MNKIINKIELKAVITNYKSFMDYIETQLEASRINDQLKVKIMTAAEEIIINIIKYAYPKNPKNLQINFEKKSGLLKFVFIDEGLAFNPLERPNADIGLSAEDREIGGLGILMVKNLMDDVKYEHLDNKNCLTILKHIT